MRRLLLAHPITGKHQLRVQGCSDATRESVNEHFYRAATRGPRTCYLSHASSEWAACASVLECVRYMYVYLCEDQLALAQVRTVLI